MENIVKQIDENILKEIVVVSDGRQNGYRSTLIVNGVQLLEGVKDVTLKISPNAKPTLTVEYNADLMPERTRIALGFDGS